MPELKDAQHKTDICIIGAGLAGLTTARELALRGWSVAASISCVLTRTRLRERRTLPCST